jgi:predicted regulator of Ras-like GTPase activity (Roadblock/LC7/MglB family)
MMSQSLHSQPISFTPAQRQQIDRRLLWFADRTGAPLVMVADVSGQLILYRGRLPSAQSTGLAALASASFAASLEIGNFLGLRNSFHQQLLEGEIASLYTLAIGPELLLIIAFTRQTVLGMVRFFAEQTKEELLKLVEEAIETRRTQQTEVEQLDADFSSAVGQQLDELFSDF